MADAVVVVVAGCHSGGDYGVDGDDGWNSSVLIQLITNETVMETMLLMTMMIMMMIPVREAVVLVVLVALVVLAAGGGGRGRDRAGGEQ